MHWMVLIFLVVIALVMLALAVHAVLDVLVRWEDMSGSGKVWYFIVMTLLGLSCLTPAVIGGMGFIYIKYVAGP